MEENHTNAMEDVLVFMQAMNDRSLLENDIDYRVWKSGYKTCDSVTSIIEDLKEGGNITLEF